MKKLVTYLLFLLGLLLPLFLGAQETKQELKDRIDNNIRNVTTAGGITKTAVANALQEITDNSQGIFYISASGTDTYTGTLLNLENYTGKWFVVKFPNANTGTCSLNLNSYGAVTLKKDGGSNLSAGDIDADDIHILAHDGTNFQVLTLGGGAGLVDGDYGDITVGSVGTTMTIDNSAVTGSKIASDVALAGNPTTTTQSAGNNSTRIATTAYADAKVANAINNGTTAIAPAQDAVFDALALKEDVANKATTLSTLNDTVYPSVDALFSERTVTGTDAIVQSDNGGLIYFNSATPFNFTIDQLTIKSQVGFLNIGSAAVTFVNGSGVTLEGSSTLSGGSNSTAVIIYKSATAPVILSDGHSGDEIRTVKVTVSTGEILALNGTPKTLIAAQGAGTLIEVLSCTYFIDYNSAAYATNTTLELMMSTAVLSTSTSILANTADTYQVQSNINLTTNVNIVNQPVTLKVPSGNPTTGNSPVYVYLTYRVITL